MSDDPNPSWKRIFLDDSSSKTNPKKSWVFGEEGEDSRGWLSRIFMDTATSGGPGSIPSCIRPREDHVFWGMHDIPVEAAGRHMLIIGTTGSGKTVSIELFLQSIAHRIRKPTPGITPERLIILDVKGTFYSFLTAQGIAPEDIHFLDPFDQRSIPWNLAKDITSDAAAQRLAALLVPSDKKGEGKFFWDASQAIVRAVIISLNTLQRGRWTLRDLLNVLCSEGHIRRLLDRVPRAKARVAIFLDNERYLPDFLTTIATGTQALETVAGLWHHSKASHEFSVADWFSNDPSKQRHGVLLLGHRPKVHDSITPINNLLLRAIADEMQSMPDVRRPHTWIVLDEFRWMKQVECMAELLGVGRSKGASILLGFQDVSGLRSVYSTDRSEEILGLCENKTFLRQGGPAAAEWASKYFGDREATETETSVTRGKETSTTESKKIVTRPLFLGSEFTNLKTPDEHPGSRIQAIHHMPILGDPIFTDEDAQIIYAMNRKPSSEHLNLHPNHLDRPEDDQFLDPWSPSEEEAILGPKPEEPPPTRPCRPRRSGPRPPGKPSSEGPDIGGFFRDSLE
jgi:type IV secretory pathway TraG/TraD family ATPase VirD4